VLIKSADDHSADITALKSLLTDARLTRFERECIEEELYSLQKGAWGEQDAAYFLNFHFRGSAGHLILHDLQIILSDGRTAQIDHLLINSFQDFYVLESKNWDWLAVEKSGACTTGSRRTKGALSPLEQCKRHVSVLERAIQIDDQLKALVPRYQIIPRVLVSPRCHLQAPHHEEWYVKADIFYSQRQKEVEAIPVLKSVLDLTRYTKKRTLIKLGQALLELHNLKPVNWRERFSLPPLDSKPRSPAKTLVDNCGLAADVPEHGEDWFILKRKPSIQIKKALNDAGYFATKEKADWVWRLRS
jgi:hypothetical protein